MKSAATLTFLFFWTILAGQKYDKAWWFNGSFSTTQLLTNYGLGAEASLALDHKILSIGYDYYNLPTKAIGNANVQDFYFSPGYQLFLSEEFSMGFRFGVAYTRFEALQYDRGGERIRFHRLYFPVKLRLNYDWSKRWGLFSELTFIPAQSMYQQSFLVGKLGLRFGKLLRKPSRKTVSATTGREKQNALTLGLNGGYSGFGFTPNLELGYNRKILLIKLGYLTSEFTKETSTFNMPYLGVGVEVGNGSFKGQFLAGLGQYYYFRQINNSSPSTWANLEVSESGLLWFFQPGVSYYLSPSWALQANILHSPFNFEGSDLIYFCTGIRYGLRW